MTRVNINGHSHQVEVDDPDGTLVDVAAAARQLWIDTLQPEPATGAASGAVAPAIGQPRIGFAWHVGRGQQPHITAHTSEETA